MAGDELLDELKKSTNTVVIQVPAIIEEEAENEQGDDFDIPLEEDKKPGEEGDHAFGDLFEDMDEAVDMAIIIADTVNQKVSEVMATWAFFDAKDRDIFHGIIDKKKNNPKFEEEDFTHEEKEYRNKYNKFQELTSGVAFSNKTKKALRKPLIKLIEKFKFMRFTAAQAVVIIVGMNNLPLLMEIVPRGFGKLKKLVSKDVGQSK